MYIQLYDSMVSWYQKSYTNDKYRRWTAAMALSVMALLNLGSFLAFCAYWHFFWARNLISKLNPVETATLAIILVVIHFQLSSRRRRHLDELGFSTTTDSPSKWPAGVYIFVSVGLFILASRLLDSQI
jgi:hypothetical protein